MTTHAILLPNWLTRCAENTPEKLAIQFGQTQWSFAELDRQATQLAHQLAAAGVRQGDRIALLAANGLTFVSFVHALIKLGAILVPLNTRLTLDELCWQLKDVKASMLVHDIQHEATAASIARQLPQLLQATLQLNGDQVTLQNGPEKEVTLRALIDLSATQAILYTSGTTGNPKGVLITYEMQWWNAIGSALNLEHHADDRWLACMPFFHIGGLSILLRSVINGISVIGLEKFDAIPVNEAIQKDAVTIISVVAVMLQRMLTALDQQQENGRYPSTLRCVLLGGGPAPLPLLQNCARRDIPIVQTYGLTESCSQAVTLAPHDALRKLGSAGRPLLPVQLRIMNEDQIAAPGETGVICLKGPSITQGYADRPEATAAAIKDGWLTTGDLGYLDEEGYLYVLDRRSDLIISGGENVYPAEIESVLRSHAAIEEAGVCGQVDQEWGQVPIAFVKFYEGKTATIEELHAHVQHYLARYKQPRTIYIVEQLPRNSAGKLLRRELHTLLPEG
ncbi:MAG TPA: o-succinylbenzoate--CoA ligase [Ktedonobacteraceae bacterium]|nr:o-succinylbenzoate--CoA ligase [Ktedonobacteraceae bacterium]